jgi:hypothetical protein
MTLLALHGVEWTFYSEYNCSKEQNVMCPHLKCSALKMSKAKNKVCLTLYDDVGIMLHEGVKRSTSSAGK